MKTFIVKSNRAFGRKQKARSDSFEEIRESAFVDLLLNAKSESLWFIPQSKMLQRFVDSLDERVFANQIILKKCSRLFLMEEITPKRFLSLNSFFKDIIAVSKDEMLSLDEIQEVRSNAHPEDLVIAGQVDRSTKTVSLVRGDLSKLTVPFSIFRKSGAGLAPNFSKFGIDDHGQTLKFGEYEASVDSVLYEFDPIYRRRRKKNILKEDQSFGASLRRLRLQKGLTQADFGDVDPREIGRIERGEVSSPHRATVERIAGCLGVEAEDIKTY